MGLEHFRAFVEMLPDFTDAPVSLPGHPARRARGGPRRAVTRAVTRLPRYFAKSTAGRWASDSFTFSAGYSKSSSFPEK